MTSCPAAVDVPSKFHVTGMQPMHCRTLQSHCYCFTPLFLIKNATHSIVFLFYFKKLSEPLHLRPKLQISGFNSDDAAEICSTAAHQAMDVMSIETKQDDDQLQSLITASHRATDPATAKLSNAYWTSGRYVNSSGSFAWHYQSSGDSLPFNYTNWAVAENNATTARPATTNVGRQCVALVCPGPPRCYWEACDCKFVVGVACRARLIKAA